MNMNPICGTGCYTGLPHARATSTMLFVHDDFGSLVPQRDREKAYNATLPHGFVPRAPLHHPLAPV